MWAYTTEESDYLSRFPGPTVAIPPTKKSARPLTTKRTSGIGRLNFPKWLLVWSRRERTRDELYRLAPRILSDLGINAGDFPAILAGTFKRDGSAADGVPRGELASRSLAMPADANPSGAIFGGWVMALMDASGAMTATRLADGRVVTVSVTGITFLRPLKVGDTVCCYTQTIRIGKTSITLGIEVWVLREGRGERSKVTCAEFTFVAVDRAGRPRPLPRELNEADVHSTMSRRGSGGTVRRG
jgi:acyl-CoA thioesterase YciA